MTRLLVSVRSPEEAALAAGEGVDLIDLKEPRRGSLGAVDFDVAQRVCERLAGSHELSMALGELTSWSDADWNSPARIPPGIVFAKIGLAGLSSSDTPWRRIPRHGVPRLPRIPRHGAPPLTEEPNWRDLWRQALRSLPPHCQAVAVAYADWRAAAAPPPEVILDEALDNGCRALLIDTWRKDQGDVFTCWAGPPLGDLLGRAREDGLLTVLAGSLRLESLPTAFDLAPDYVAVRGAVCRGLRESELCRAKISQWVELIGRQADEERRSFS